MLGECASIRRHWSPRTNNTSTQPLWPSPPSSTVVTRSSVFFFQLPNLRQQESHLVPSFLFSLYHLTSPIFPGFLSDQFQTTCFHLIQVSYLPPSTPIITIANSISLPALSPKLGRAYVIFTTVSCFPACFNGSQQTTLTRHCPHTGKHNTTVATRCSPTQS